MRLDCLNLRNLIRFLFLLNSCLLDQRLTELLTRALGLLILVFQLNGSIVAVVDLSVLLVYF